MTVQPDKPHESNRTVYRPLPLDAIDPELLPRIRSTGVIAPNESSYPSRWILSSVLVVGFICGAAFGFACGAAGMWMLFR